ncbi:acyltransferase [Heyndrickxia coagulans]|uniref:Acyltransferase n=1 Tax=Heyndrickxia coagulans TaxID=1398 RepID=A0AAW7C938_HEYCO|nr:acyltransferase [Heyndrickxia coagulans]MDL5039748.1 acyltransferase [Heyndrickxia coagulans]
MRKYKVKRLPLVGKMFVVELIGKDSKINFEGKFYCRNNIYMVAENGNINIGDNVFLNNGVSICSMKSISIGNNSALGENVKIYDQDHVFNKSGLMYKQGYKKAPVVIGNNVWIGSNVVILKGVHIGTTLLLLQGQLLQKMLKTIRFILIKEILRRKK